jgi:AraC-like DNA-binding protein
MPALLPSDHLHARLVLGIVVAAASAGIDAQSACRRAGIAPEALAAPDATVPVPAGLSLWQALEELSGDPTVGLAVAERVPVGVLGFVYHSMHASETLRDACRRASRYNRLVAGPVRLSLRERADEAALVLETARPPVPKLPFPLVQHILLFALRAMQSAVADLDHAGAEGGPSPWSGRAGPLRPREVSFVHPLRGASARFEAAFRAPCRFGAERAALVFARGDLDRSVPSGDPTLARWLDVVGDARIADHERVDAAARVRAATRELLSHGEPRLARVAAELRTQPRALQRRLAEAGTSFAAVVDEVRCEVALRMVAEAGVSLTDVAFVTGFSELSAFHRAFRRWTGTTPVRYRRDKSA